jgi:putative FmdB family regulatory protein
MPVYEYECKKCGHQFSVVLSMEAHEHDKDKVRCPKCNSKEVKHLVESVFVTTSRKS